MITCLQISKESVQVPCIALLLLRASTLDGNKTIQSITHVVA